MKQTTIFDYFLDLPKQANDKRYTPLNKNNQNLQNKNQLAKTFVQKTLSQIITQQEQFQKIKDLLGASWFRQENGFGFTDESNIMIVGPIQDFNSKFFKLYKFEDFKNLIDLNIKIDEIKEDKNKFLRINEAEYNSYYLFKSFQILGKQIKFFQHETLKLLFLKNSKFASLICPKF
jgi:hypothetical protein